MALALLVLVTAGGQPLAAGAQPQPPATFYGTASIDGVAPPRGVRVVALIDGVDCTQPDSGEIVLQDGISVYVLTVFHESQQAGCGAEGREVAFEVDGRPATEDALWSLGATEVNLNAGEGAPLPIPDAFATAQAGGLTSGVTAAPEETGGGDGSGFPWGRAGIAALAIGGLAATIAGAVLRARTRARGITGP